MLKAVLFDLGDTVFRERLYDLEAGVTSIALSAGINESILSLQNAITLGQKNNREFSILDWILKYSDQTIDNSASELIEIELWDKTVSLEPIIGVREALQFLSDRSVRVAAFSNAIFSSKCISYELKKYSLDKYFEFVVSSADIGLRKPHRMAFEKSLQLLELSDFKVCYIGDNWTADVLGASSANILPIHFGDKIDDTGTSVEHYQLDNWSDFNELWEKLNINNKPNR